ncbi:MAG: hypothetical protein L0219_20435 [Phycisphaerales bacterium]|nr:hypothetical protein [Phycisphaerales bacterium]MCI0676711.1 hypothetical protein [Phycisphaerales bacterium]
MKREYVPRVFRRFVQLLGLIAVVAMLSGCFGSRNASGGMHYSSDPDGWTSYYESSYQP